MEQLALLHFYYNDMAPGAAVIYPCGTRYALRRARSRSILFHTIEIGGISMLKKRLLVFTLALTLLLSLTACGGDGDATSGSDQTTTQEATQETTESEVLWYPDNIMAHYSYSSMYGNDNYSRGKISTITFLDTLKDMPDSSWDVSEAQDGSVMAWVLNGDDLYIAGEGGVALNPNSQCMFSDFENVTEINFNGCVYTDLVVDMNGFFQWCVSLEAIDLSGWRTRNTEKMAGMFSHCESLTELDVSALDTRNVRTFDEMFAGCESLVSLDLSSFSSASLKYVGEMFYDCKSLTTLDISTIDTSRCEDFAGMFNGCSSLTVLDLSHFDFSKATRTTYMFYGCTNLTDIGCTITLPEDCDTEDMYTGSGLQ